MSRSAESPTAAFVAWPALLSAAVLAIIAGAVDAGPASAEPAHSPAGPVVPITALVVDIHTGTGSVDGSQATEKTERGARTRLDSSVLFAKDSARLRPRARTEIQRVARELGESGPGRVTVTGYTDDLGPASHGLHLSRRRATVVAAELDRHLDDTWPGITVIGEGENDPAVPNTSEANRKLNRRVVIVVRR
jgi:outer membrane protein OmpA-like peptidoglycan-associated protein